MNLNIKEIPIKERPRERLIYGGADQLSNEELLAILLKTGTKDTNAKVLSNILLKKLEKLENLKYCSYQNLSSMKGIGAAKACTLLAAVELGKRIQRPQHILFQKFQNPLQIANYYQEKLGAYQQECFLCIYLDSAKKMVKEKILFIGTLNRSLVHPREIFKEAFQVSAHSIICLHNHPSGEVTPSKEDIVFTDHLVEIGKLMGIEVIDHIIVGKDKYYSFYENDRIAL